MKKWFGAVLVIAALASVGPARANQLSPGDERIYHRAFEALHKDEFTQALAVSAKAHDPLLDKVVHWAYYVAPNSGALFGDITSFIAANPTWPQVPTLQRRAEEAITAATPGSAIIRWFDAYAPVTVDGAMAYGKALIDSGQTAKAEPIVRKAWIEGNFGSIQQRQFLVDFENLLTPADQQARLDHLLWDRQETAAREQMHRVGASYRQLAQARLALQNDAANAEELAAGVPEALKADPGLIYDLLRYRRSHDRDDAAIALLSHPSRNKVRPGLWWTERAILARRALQRGRVSEAYEIARDHEQTDGVGFAEAEWLAGWIALRFLGDRQVALTHFQRMYERVSTPQSRSRAAYWAGRAAEALGKSDQASHWYSTAGQYVTTFYGQMAAARVNREHQWPLPADPLPSAAEIQWFERHELVRVARMLGQIKETDYIRPFMLRMNDLAHSPGQRSLAANLATTLGRADIAVAVAKRSEREGVPLIASGYPIPALPLGGKPERALVLGLIRQESAFHYQAVSSAGARGLMQLMPNTATKVAKAMNVVFKKKDQLTNALTRDPGLNVKLGSAFLDDLLDDFNGSYILAIASYNAGPTRVRKWVHDLGDPRSTDVDAIDWIESIPYSETRNYTQRVLEGVQIYRHRLGSTGLALSLDADLKRSRGVP